MHPAILLIFYIYLELYSADISLRGKLLVYDNVEQKIGWTNSDCAKPQKSRGFPFFL